MSSLTPAISSKLYVWSETLKSLCSFYMCSMRHFKCFSNLGTWGCHLNSFINMQSQSCGLWPLFVKVCTDGPERTLRVIFTATHHWWHWGIVGIVHVTLWTCVEVSWKIGNISLFSLSGVVFTQAFLQEKQWDRHLPLLLPLCCLHFLKLNFLIHKLPIVSFSVIFVYICLFWLR